MKISKHILFVLVAGFPFLTFAAGNPFLGAKLYVSPTSNAKHWAEANRATRPSDAALMDKIADESLATWFGNWNRDVQSAVNDAVTKATNAGALPVLVAYNIPWRDCRSYSGGVSASVKAYQRWMRSFASGIGNRKAVVLLEPDALASLDCLNSTQQQKRLELIRHAVRVLNGLGGTSVYLDGGHPHWHLPEVMADRLRQAGVGEVRGFTLNVSNFVSTDISVSYGNYLSGLLGGKAFIIDTSRNGLGLAPNYEWCNPEGRALGSQPTTTPSHSLVDALLWVKEPGASDGQCNGGPAAGVFWPEYALGLAKRANW